MAYTGHFRVYKNLESPTQNTTNVTMTSVHGVFKNMTAHAVGSAFSSANVCEKFFLLRRTWFTTTAARRLQFN